MEVAVERFEKAGVSAEKTTVIDGDEIIKTSGYFNIYTCVRKTCCIIGMPFLRKLAASVLAKGSGTIRTL